MIVPQQVEGLLVPVAVSATHMGFGTIRMEPCWMQLGYAAGVAADLSLKQSVPIRSVSIDQLQDELLRQGQLITYFRDLAPTSPVGKACQYFGTKGFFPTYDACAEEAVTLNEASRWIVQARSLEGGRRLPVLPATDRLLPAGVDMGPRLPAVELHPREYWEEVSSLPRNMLESWISLAARTLGVKKPQLEAKEQEPVTKGYLLYVLYALLEQSRQKQ